ncbi:MAG: glycoside hydrolase N-terminal domain-containing protein, partial [Clostridia bacterium]|nr:glycoside hydrolase N-terminal domain-containing protein [Clostridia bacterium]
MKILKRALSVLLAVSMLPAFAATGRAEDKEDTGMSFNPETVMWTNNKIENVLAQTGKYSNAAQVNPNADSKASSGVQNPYAKPGELLTEWAYSEFLWTNSYPIGNGRMAGMVAGGIDKEVIQINEDTAWDGSPYGTLINENGETVTTQDQANAAGTITAVNPTSGSKADGWKYFRGADSEGNPAPIGSADAIVGDEAFRTNYPDFADKSLSYQALNISNDKTQDAVQGRWNLEKMVEATFLGSPTRQRAYKSFAEVYLDFGQSSRGAENYVKSLNMEKGIVTVEYDYDGHHYKRESFASYPDQVVATHVESDADLDFSAELHTYHSEKAGCYSYEKLSDNEVKVSALITNGSKNKSDPGTLNVIKFEARMLLSGDGEFTVADDNKTVSVKGGKSADIYVVGATNYVDYLHLDNSKPSRDCDTYMANVKSKSYETIKSRHIEDFSAEFKKTSLHLDNANDADFSDIPTEKRVREDIDGKSGFLTGASSRTSDANKVGVRSTYSDGDNTLAALEFNYGKYLILSGSRDGRSASGEGEIDIPESQPLNLTGKWNAAFSASWNGKYTININTEMNYWAAEPLNIGESERPFIDTFSELAKSGAITAANQYGIYNDRGDNEYRAGDPWVMHHNYDLWRGTQPIDNATAGLWPTGGVWLLEHAWQYYEYNRDEEYLAEIYPYMVGAAKFFTEFLVVDPKTGYLVTAASCSPEQGGVQPGPAMDTQLIRNLYDTFKKASAILGKTDENSELIAKIDEQMPSTYLGDETGKIAPNLIDQNGLIKEWARGDVTFDIGEKTGGDWTVTNPFKNSEAKEVYPHQAGNNTTHRHCSHLWEIFPGTHLSAYTTDADEKAIFEAYQKSVAARGVGTGQGWGLAWRINLNARALDGNAASTMLEQLFTTRTSPNLFDQHPNFQIDGNYGATSGIIEMLMQSHDGAIDLLPALPDKWQSGHYTGLKARGGATVDCVWENGDVLAAKIKAAQTGEMSVRADGIENAAVRDSEGNTVTAEYNNTIKALTFSAADGEEYTIDLSGGDNDKVSMTYSNGMVTIKGTENQDAVLIQSVYENNALVRVNTYDVKLTNGVTLQQVEDIPSSKLMLWKKLSGEGEMEPLCGVETVPEYKAVPTVTDPPEVEPTETPEPTEIPQLGNSWVCSSDDSAKKTGDLVMNGLSLLFDVSSSGQSAITIDGKSFTNYISSANNGSWAGSSGTASGTAFKYVAPADGTFTIYVYKLGSNKELCITKEGVKENKTAAEGTAAYYKNTSGDVENKSLSLEVKKGETYYTYVAGSKGSFVGAELVTTGAAETPQPTGTPNPTSTPQPDTTPDPNAKGAYIGSTKYDTVTAALASITTTPASESDRVYIDLMPGVYREQVVVNKPYVTIRKKAGTEGEAKITWYYGMGSLYDSCNASGYYDESAIGDRESYRPSDWGAALKVSKNANNFTAENITLENSYNRYYTTEELTDITGVDPDTNNSMFHRLDWITEQKEAGKTDDYINDYLKTRTIIDYKGVSSSPRERSAAFHSSADRVQVINCEIISTQDTMGINTGRIYFKDCTIGGTTDYICGSATAVFDNCTLFTNAGNSNNGSGESATITAPANPATSDGYLFYNCTIDGTQYATAGDLGRPWGENVAAAYINTTINHSKLNTSTLLIKDAGWINMSGNKAEDARFKEYGSVDDTGAAVDTSKRTKGTILNEWTMLRYNPFTFTKGTDNWDPANVSSNYDGVNSVIADTTIDTSDGSTNEITLPSAPAGYEFYWESDSEFALVNDDKTKITLIRPAYGENAIKTTVKLYARKADDTKIGAEKSIEFNITPTSDTENVFTVSGSVNLAKASDSAQTVTLAVKKDSAVIKTETVTVPAGETSKSYTMENIPVGSYTIYPTAENAEYNITTEPKEITGAKGNTVTYDVNISKMETITVTDGDFETLTPTVTTADGFTASLYTVTDSETANLGTSGEKVYKLTKDEGKTVAKNVGVSFDLKSLLRNGTSLANTKSI